MPFEVPESWEWVKLGYLCDYGKNEKASPSEINENAWILDLEDIEKDTGKLLKRVHKSEKETKSIRNTFKKGDVLYSKLRTYLNKVLVADFEGYCTTEILPLDFNGFVVPEFARHVLMSNYFLEYTAECCYGVKMPRLGTYDGENALFPLPPIEEQKRIVRIIDSVNEIIDEIEESALSLEQYITQTKSKVLDLAIRGKLVPQNPDDEPASVLLEQVMKGQKVQQNTADKFPYPFEIPKSWEWCKLGEIGDWQSGSTPSRAKKEYYNGDINWLKTGDLTDDYIYNISEKITQKALLETSVKLNPIGSVLIAMYGATIGKVGILTQPATTNQACCACSNFRGINNLYLFYLLIAYRNYFIQLGEGGAQPNISKEKIISTDIPLPPLAEQLRIVEKIEEIFKMLDKMQVNLQANT